MSLLVTDAVVLHVSDYLESSRLLRLATREAGVQSVLARGARSSKKRFGSAIDLFAEGQAQLQLKPGRDLHTLTSFDVSVSRPGLALDLGRFVAASAIAECVLRLLHEESAPQAYATLVEGLDRLAVAAPAETATATLGALWQVVAQVGFTPAIDRCAECHAEIASDAEVHFHHPVGGALCPLCTRLVPGGRRLPPDARDALRQWLAGALAPVDEPAARAHQRLLREFLAQHLPDHRPLKAYQVWEQGRW
jgi:DNA repair protein RecO (recombination protein O)